MVLSIVTVDYCFFSIFVFGTMMSVHLRRGLLGLFYLDDVLLKVHVVRSLCIELKAFIFKATLTVIG
jgi:hypothetical protein